jgi:hypothetical protein
LLLISASSWGYFLMVKPCWSIPPKNIIFTILVFQFLRIEPGTFGCTDCRHPRQVQKIIKHSSNSTVDCMIIMISNFPDGVFQSFFCGAHEFNSPVIRCY